MQKILCREGSVGGPILGQLDLNGAGLCRTLFPTGGDAASHKINALLERLASPNLLADGAKSIFEIHDV